MDKKPFLQKSLARIMFEHLDQIKDVVSEHSPDSVVMKADGSPVTTLDIALSELVESIAGHHLDPQVTFYSEEKFSSWAFPLLALDPLDGTREYVANRPEWAISLGLFNTSSFEGEGWVYNPVTNELFNEDTHFKFRQKETYVGEVSRSEWKAGLYVNKESERFKIKEMGSIAYKLGRLSAGKIDFVVSLKPKNIWDIAGGTLLCHKSNIKFFSEGKEVTEVKSSYNPPLIWCPKELSSELLKIFS